MYTHALKCNKILSLSSYVHIPLSPVLHTGLVSEEGITAFEAMTEHHSAQVHVILHDTERRRVVTRTPLARSDGASDGRDGAASGNLYTFC